MKKRWGEVLSWFLLAAVGIAGRLLPHPPNFTPVEALSLYGGAWSPNLWTGLGLVLLVMGLTDLIVGWHGLWPFTWGSMAIGVLLGRYIFQMNRFGQAMGAALLQAVLFFLVTNFGVWLQGWYGLTASGLVACYIAAIPFFHYQLLGAVFYTGLLWVLNYRLVPYLSAKALSNPRS